jgi:hypothetical protein
MVFVETAGSINAIRMPKRSKTSETRLAIENKGEKSNLMRYRASQKCASCAVMTHKSGQ